MILMARRTTGWDRNIIVYKYSVEWKIYDITGGEIDRGAKPIETKEKALAFAQKLKRSISDDKSIDVLIRRLEGNEIIRRLKKKAYKKNYKRR